MNQAVRTFGAVIGPFVQGVLGALEVLGRIAGNFVVPALIGMATAFTAARVSALALAAFQRGQIILEKALAGARIALLTGTISLSALFTGLATSLGAAIAALGPFALIGIAVGGLALLFMGLEDPIFEFKMAMQGLGDWLSNFFGYMSNTEYKQRLIERDRQRAERDRQRREENAFNGQIENYNDLYDVQQRDLQARKNLANYSNPIDEFQQFAKQQNAHDLITGGMTDTQRADYYENLYNEQQKSPSPPPARWTCAPGATCLRATTSCAATGISTRCARGRTGSWHAAGRRR